MIISSQNQVIPIKRIAAIDLGTNSFHAIIVDVYSDGSFRTLDKLKEMVVLAKGGLGTHLSDAAFKRGMTALRNIKRLADSYECEQILAYATSAIREAENGGEFIQRSIDELSIKINAIPGRVEAELIGLAVRHGIKMDQKPLLLCDIGGGSVEFLIGNDSRFFFTTSKKIGVSRMTEVFKPADPISADDIQKLEAHYEEQLQDVAEAFAQHRTDTLVGSSGTMENIALMIASFKKKTVDVTLNEMEFSAADFMEFYEYFIRLNKSKRAKVSGLDTKRVNFINTGMVLVHLLLRKFGIQHVRISTQALREGIIIRYLKKEMIGLSWNGEFADPRKRSLFELLRKTNWHEHHSRHVADMALKIFDALSEELQLKADDRELLEYASYLHDIGYYISHSKHHKHALYLIRNADLKGFREEEIEIMAHVARYHRRSTPKKRHAEYWKLKAGVRKRIKKLSAILRVADGLDRSHYQNVKHLQVYSETDQIRMNIRTEGAPYLEIWGAERKSDLFKEMTGKKLTIRHIPDTDIIG